MLEMNWVAILVAALVPTVTGMIWYNPGIFGKIWMKSAGLSTEDIKKANMPVMMILSLIFSVALSFYFQTISIHQASVIGLVGADESNALPSFQAFMKDYGTAYRTFKHGAAHGIFAGLFMIFPIITIIAQFEMKKWSYILVNSGYWILTLALMGGILCAWE